MLLSLLGAAHAAVLFGVAWTPAGVGALAWDDAGAYSGTLAGEYDGLLRPPLTAHGGWVGRQQALLGGVAAVGFGNTTFSDTTSRTRLGGLRLSLDARQWLHPREAGRAGLYGDLGGYGIVPLASDTSDAYTAEEVADAEEGAAADRARIGGFGGQAGVGAEYVFGDREGRPAVAVGARWLARLHRAQASQEDATTVSTVLLTEAALVLEIVR